MDLSSGQSDGGCGGLNENGWPPQAQRAECLVSSWWNHLGGIRRRGRVGGGASLLGGEVSKAHAIPN